ncbi:MAG: hypothetical protein QM820_47965 [Minicystis sp.]
MQSNARRLAASFVVVALAACAAGPSPEGGSAPNPGPAAPIGPTTSQTATTSAPGVAGKWSSASCGARAYERRLVLDSDGSFTAEDRVSPCPPNVACVWSGIVIRRGKYAMADGAIQLAVDGPNAGPGQPLPPTLAMDASGAPAEVLDGGTRCPYTRVR